MAHAVRTLAESLDHAGAVMVLRDDHPVPAHYGSAAAELAVCVKRAGAAVRSDLDILELAGGEGWLGQALEEALGVDALAAGTAVHVAGALCCLVEPGRAFLVGAPDEVARCRRLARQQAIRSGHSVGCEDRSATMTALSLVGPRAAALLAAAGLPADAPVGGVRTGTLASGPVILLHERAERHLLLVAGDRAAEACAELFQVGRPFGLSFVGLDALERLSAVTPAAAARA